MDTKELLKKVRKIEIKTRRLSNHVFGGEYQSAFKGRGMTFSEVRQYQYGDDIRAIDWNVTARYNSPFVKIFEEERELTLMLLADVSGSGFFGTDSQTKSDIITEISATLAFSAIQNNDKVGLILFTDKVELYIPPKKGKSHVLRIIRELIEFKPEHKETDLSAALSYLNAVQKKKAIVFVLSDFISHNYKRPLQICSNRHDVSGVRVYDKGEQKIPNLGMIMACNNETGETLWVNTSSRTVRQKYQDNYKSYVDYYKESFTKSGCGIIDVDVRDNYAKHLHTYFKSI